MDFMDDLLRGKSSTNRDLCRCQYAFTCRFDGRRMGAYLTIQVFSVACLLSSVDEVLAGRGIGGRVVGSTVATSIAPSPIGPTSVTNVAAGSFGVVSLLVTVELGSINDAPGEMSSTASIGPATAAITIASSCYTL